MNTLVTSAKLVASAAILSGLSVVPASAATFLGLTSTGAGSTGDNQADTHYTVGGLPTFTTSNPAYISVPGASFIAAAQNGGGGSATFSLDFLVSGTDFSSATISGQTAYDNGVTVFLNGVQLYQDLPGAPGTYDAFQALHGFTSAPGQLLLGSNTLTFQLVDYGAPAGLLVTDLQGINGAVPEPATWGMMLLGFGLIGAGARSRKRSNVRMTYA